MTKIENKNLFTTHVIYLFISICALINISYKINISENSIIISENYDLITYKMFHLINCALIFVPNMDILLSGKINLNTEIFVFTITTLMCITDVIVFGKFIRIILYIFIWICQFLGRYLEDKTELIWWICMYIIHICFSLLHDTFISVIIINHLYFLFFMGFFNGDSNEKHSYKHVINKYIYIWFLFTLL
jgi:hypothetical protein